MRRWLSELERRSPHSKAAGDLMLAFCLVGGVSLDKEPGSEMSAGGWAWMGVCLVSLIAWLGASLWVWRRQKRSLRVAIGQRLGRDQGREGSGESLICTLAYMSLPVS